MCQNKSETSEVNHSSLALFTVVVAFFLGFMQFKVAKLRLENYSDYWELLNSQNLETLLLQHRTQIRRLEVYSAIQLYNALGIWTVAAQQLRNSSFLPQHRPQTHLPLCIWKKHQQLFPMQQNMLKNEEDVRVKRATLTLTEWSQYTVEIHSVQNLKKRPKYSKMHLEKWNTLLKIDNC